MKFDNQTRYPPRVFARREMHTFRVAEWEEKHPKLNQPHVYEEVTI